MRCAEDEITDDPAVVRDPAGDTEGTVQGEGSGYGVTGRTHTADPLSDVLSIAWVSSLEDKLNAPEKRAGTLGVYYCAVLHLGFNLEVSFDTSYGVYENAAHLVKPPLLAGTNVGQSDLRGL